MQEWSRGNQLGFSDVRVGFVRSGRGGAYEPSLVIVCGLWFDSCWDVRWGVAELDEGLMGV